MVLTALIPWLQIVLSGVLIGLILLQQSDADLGSAFGGGGEAGLWRTKRGLEKFLFTSTIVVAIIFALSALVALFI